MKQKLAGICGILSLIIFILFILISIFSTSWFSFTNNYLSELGGEVKTTDYQNIYSYHGISSIFLNLSLIVTGILIMCFSVFLYKTGEFKTIIEKISLSFVFLNALDFVGIGVFPATLGYMHVLCSWIFFVSIPVVIITFGYVMSKKSFNNKLFYLVVIFTSILCLTVTTAFMQRLAIFGKAISEMVVIISMLIFYTIISCKLLNIKFNWRLKLNANNHKINRNTS